MPVTDAAFVVCTLLALINTIYYQINPRTSLWFEIKLCSDNSTCMAGSGSTLYYSDRVEVAQFGDEPALTFPIGTCIDGTAISEGFGNATRLELCAGYGNTTTQPDPAYRGGEHGRNADLARSMQIGRGFAIGAVVVMVLSLALQALAFWCARRSCEPQRLTLAARLAIGFAAVLEIASINGFAATFPFRSAGSSEFLACKGQGKLCGYGTAMHQGLLSVVLCCVALGLLSGAFGCRRRRVASDKEGLIGSNWLGETPMAAPVPTSAPQPMVMDVKVPLDAAPGFVMEVVDPHTGQALSVQVPAGVPPGGTFQVQLAAAQPSVMMPVQQQHRAPARTCCAADRRWCWAAVLLLLITFVLQSAFYDANGGDTFCGALRLEGDDGWDPKPDGAGVGFNCPAGVGFCADKFCDGTQCGYSCCTDSNAKDFPSLIPDAGRDCEGMLKAVQAAPCLPRSARFVDAFDISTARDPSSLQPIHLSLAFCQSMYSRCHNGTIAAHAPAMARQRVSKAYPHFSTSFCGPDGPLRLGEVRVNAFSDRAFSAAGQPRLSLMSVALAVLVALWMANNQT